MAILKYNNIGITAISACVPSHVVRTTDLRGILTDDDIEKTIHNIGIKERRIANPETCASDLCMKAAMKLITDNLISPNSIDALIFVSQTPDYRQPATAPILQHKLGLPKSTLSFDINLACSGYIYGLATTFAYAASGLNRILLLNGDTMSRIVSRKDKSSTQLFGDAGTATLIERGNYSQSVFSLNSDGSGYDVMIIPNGGARNPSTPESQIEKLDESGIWRSLEQFHMDGMGVFNFGMNEEPRDVQNLLQESQMNISDIDLLIYHQANKFMTDFFSKWLKIDKSKTPYCIDRFGNTSSASIPLTIASELRESYPNRNNVILSGFGAGLSWGSMLTSLSKCKISELVEL